MIYTVTNKYLKFQINSKGAELISLKKTVDDREYIWEGNPEFWNKQSPVLFPIVGTLKNNEFVFEGKKYNLPRHGFARDMEFNLVKQTENEVVFSLKSNKLTQTKFPFNFELKITYSLKENELSVIYTIINKDNKVMPFSIGGHPAFALCENFEDYSLEFEQNEILKSYELEADLLSEKIKLIPLTNKVLPLTYSLFEKDALIFKTLQSKQIKITKNNSPILNFKFSDFPNFGIWTKPNAPFICLEPWAGYSDTQDTTGNILEKEGIQFLQNGDSKEYSFCIEIL